MSLFILFLIGSLLVGLLGANRTLGFWGGFFASFLVTPLGGLLLVAVSGAKQRKT